MWHYREAIEKIAGMEHSIAIFSLFLLLAVPPMAGADFEYNKMLQELNQRYEDFFVHQNEQERWSQRVRSGVADHKRLIAEEQRAAVEALKEQRRNRRAEPDLSEFEKQHEARQRAEALEMEKERKLFSQRRRELEKIEASARRLSDIDELQLYTEF